VQIHALGRAYQPQTSSDTGGKADGLQEFMVRLAFLGMAVFVVLIVLVVSASVATQQLQEFTPTLAEWFLCQQTCACPPCASCDALHAQLDQYQLQPGLMGLELFCMSAIAFLVGVFFTMQSLQRQYGWVPHWVCAARRRRKGGAASGGGGGGNTTAVSSGGAGVGGGAAPVVSAGLGTATTETETAVTTTPTTSMVRGGRVTT